MADGLTRAQAEALDAGDPLAAFRDRFVSEEGGPIYVDGNSLGRLPHATAERIEAFAAEWGSRLVTGWPDWIELPRAVGDLLAEDVLGARPGEVLVCDSVTVNLFKLAGAVLDAGRGAGGYVCMLAGDFPTDRYVLEGLARLHDAELRFVERHELADAARDARLTVVSKVDYRSGEVLQAGDVPGLVLWDLSHAAGAIELDLHESGAQLAVGCTYKYLNAGPGAPAFLYVREELQEQLRSPIQGWFGQREQFAMGPAYEPAPGIDRFLAGTPSIIDLVAVRSGAELVAEAGMPAIAAKTRALTGLFVALHDAWLAPLGFTLASPREAARRGGHVSLAHPEGWQVCRALIERAGVVPDFRGAGGVGLVRFGFPALYTRFTDVFDAAERTRDLVASGAHLEVDAARARVT